MHPPLPDYAPVDLATQIRHAEKVLAITANVVDKAVAQHRMHELEAACEKQRCQSIVRTLKALEAAMGPGAIVRTPDDFKAAFFTLLAGVAAERAAASIIDDARRGVL